MGCLGGDICLLSCLEMLLLLGEGEGSELFLYLSETLLYACVTREKPLRCCYTTDVTVVQVDALYHIGSTASNSYLGPSDDRPAAISTPSTLTPCLRRIRNNPIAYIRYIPTRPTSPVNHQQRRLTRQNPSKTAVSKPPEPPLRHMSSDGLKTHLNRRSHPINANMPVLNQPVFEHIAGSHRRRGCASCEVQDIHRDIRDRRSRCGCRSCSGMRSGTLHE